jgi:uncharacterized SAM-binding protein YcdF (DUF218 family)
VTYFEPALPLLLLLILADVIRAWRSSEKGRRPWLVTIGVAGIWFVSINVGAWLLSRPLEIWYTHTAVPTENGDAIVVLSGAVTPPSPRRPYPLAGQDTYRRVQHAAWLFQRWKALPILASGGGRLESPHAEVMRQMLIAAGVPADSIWTESESTNTHESAVYGTAILRAHNVSRIILVTEASSMLRAARSFRKQGFHVVPAPMQFNRLNGTPEDLLPGWAPLASTGDVIHELVGLAWYKLRGWI